MFITFEGADGCGKTTQQMLAADYLESKGYEVLITREPGAKGLGEDIRKILLDYKGPVSERCESLLFLADRAQHVDNMILPAIENGQIVLCDRYTDSTVAYQGYGRQQNLERIKKLNDFATNLLKPDLTFVFDIDVETSMQRVGKEKDRMESEGKEFHNRVRNGYLKLAEEEPNRIKVLDAAKSIDEIHEEVVNILEAAFLSKEHNL
ncbi:MAG: dTMP kinase [Candidatus Melainabacteria bacterium 35_41]|nr:MAG: dTMP kinase [Candidatus Melainabacteria bacterium 35_41]